jgi:hypothetical protein
VTCRQGAEKEAALDLASRQYLSDHDQELPILGFNKRGSNIRTAGPCPFCSHVNVRLLFTCTPAYISSSLYEPRTKGNRWHWLHYYYQPPDEFEQQVVGCGCWPYSLRSVLVRNDLIRRGSSARRRPPVSDTSERTSFNHE